MIVSATGTALGLVVMGVYSMLKSFDYDVDAFNWIPIFSFSFVIFISNCGILTLTFLIITEVMPEELKNFGTSFCTQMIWLFAFLILKYLPFLTANLGMHGSMFLFAGVCLSSALFIFIVLPETKGRSHAEIMELLQ